MSPIVVMVAAAALGVEVGWQPIDGGGYEYTIQIEPQLLDLLKKGNDEIFSEVPPGINVRRYRVIVGSGPLARETGEPTPAAKAVGPVAEAAPAPGQPSAEFDAPPVAAGDRYGAPTPAAEPDFGTPPTDTSDRYGTPPEMAGNDFGAPPAAASDRYGSPPADEPIAADTPAGSENPFGNPPEDSDLETADDGQPPPTFPNAAGDPWSGDDLGQAAPRGAAEEHPAGAGVAAEEPPPEPDVVHAPGRLPDDPPVSGPIQATFDAHQAAADTEAAARETQKPPTLDEEPSRPWGVLIGAVLLLGCSLGANLYLGWIAWDARSRYRGAVAKLRTTG